jgi:hypothetical protein
LFCEGPPKERLRGSNKSGLLGSRRSDLGNQLGRLIVTITVAVTSLSLLRGDSKSFQCRFFAITATITITVTLINALNLNIAKPTSSRSSCGGIISNFKAEA